GSVAAASSIAVKSGGWLDAVSQSGGWRVPAGQTLSGGGTVLGPVLVNGALAPGDGLGTLSFSNSLVLGGSATFELNKSGLPQSNDGIVAGGTLTLGGQLVVSNTGPAFAAGDVFTLFSAPVLTGSFTNLVLPAAGSGLVWNAGTLPVDGVLRIQAVPPPQIHV